MELSVVLVEMGVGVGRKGWALGDPDPLAVGTSCLRAFNNKDGKNAQVSSHSLRLVPSLAEGGVAPRGTCGLPADLSGYRHCRGVSSWHLGERPGMPRSVVAQDAPPSEESHGPEGVCCLVR